MTVQDPKIQSPMPQSLADNYRLLLQGVNSVRDYAIFVLSPEGIILTWNVGAECIQGYKPDEIIGKHFSIFYPQEAKDRDHPGFELKTAKEKGQFEEEGWRIRKDGSMFWANVVITPVLDADKTLLGFTKVTRDLTERKIWEQELKSAQLEMESARTNYRMLIEGIRDYAIFMLDPNGVVMTWNAGAERNAGYKAHEIIGKHFSIFYQPEDIESGKCEFELKYAQVEGHFEDEGWRVRKDGTKYWSNVTITPIRNETGELVGFSKVTRDVTARKDAEQALAESEKRFKQMANRVMERTIQLESVNKELEAFSYSVSHDLRAPLRSIDGFSQALLEMYDEQLDEQGKRYLQNIRRGSQEMARLIDDMLELSRLTRGTLNVEHNLNLSELAVQVVNNLKTRDPERQVDVEIESDLKTPGDKRLMTAVLENLLGNAWKFTSKKENARIEFGLCHKENKPVYYIKDNGAGFDMAYVKKLFGAFQRLHGAGDFPGTGIGLASVQRIIHRHGGEIWAEGEVDKGATFYFTLDQAKFI